MRRLFAALNCAVVLSQCLGCVSRPSTRTCVHPSSVIANYYMAPAGDLSAEELRHQADDPKASISTRCKAIITLFGKHVPLNSTSEEVGKIIGEAKWLTNAVASVRPVTMGVPDPVDARRGSVFYLSLFSSQMSGQQNVSLCLLLSGSSGNGTVRAPGSPDSATELLRFLRGQNTGEQVRMLEYAVMWRNGDNTTDVTVKEGDVAISEMQRQDGKPVAARLRILAGPGKLDLLPTTWSLPTAAQDRTNP